MPEPFLAELRIFSFGFPPRGWAQCNGQLMQINQNQALFSLLGTTYGGDGRTTFALPDLRGRVPTHWGNGMFLGERAGEETHTLTVNEMPAHTHTLQASSQSGDVNNPAVLAAANNLYRGTDAGLTPVGAAPPNGPSISPPTGGGGGPAHENMMPFAVLNVCIALQGIFPSRN